MFEFHDANIEKEKCYTTIGKFPAIADSENLPAKKIPFSTAAGYPFIHTTELILPEEVYSNVWQSIESRISDAGHYARVIMPLSALLDGDFFNKYIKTGDILMISEGRSGVDEVYSLRNGILRLELDKSSYEKAGLVGKAIRSGGRKHVKSRYAVEINLRPPSMLHGKKGFERIVSAFANVLNQSVSWLFCDLASPSSLLDEDAPIKKHFPQILAYTPTQTALSNVLVPPLSLEKLADGGDRTSLRDSCHEIQEWLALVSLGSPRIRGDDSVDPYFSRYGVPNREECKASNLVKVTWRGLLHPAWLTRLLAGALNGVSDVSSSQDWFAITASALGKDAVESKDGFTILALPSKEDQNGLQSQKGNPGKASQPATDSQREFICWEYAGNTYWESKRL